MRILEGSSYVIRKKRRIFGELGATEAALTLIAMPL